MSESGAESCTDILELANVILEHSSVLSVLVLDTTLDIRTDLVLDSDPRSAAISSR